MIDARPKELELLEKFGFRIEFLSEIDSTNSEAFRRAEKGEDSGLVLVAEHQSSGRGRMGREWSSFPKSSLLVSVLLKPFFKAEDLGLIPILSGISIAEAVEEIAGFKPGLIWPNDLFGSIGKLGGILVETKFLLDKPEWVVIGTGVNLIQKKEDFPEEIREGAGSIFMETGRIISRDELLFSYLKRVGFWLRALGKKERLKIVEKYSEYDIIMGNEIILHFQNRKITGIALGIDLNGGLLVKAGDEEIRANAGEVIMLRRKKDAFGD